MQRTCNSFLEYEFCHHQRINEVYPTGLSHSNLTRCLPSGEDVNHHHPHAHLDPVGQDLNEKGAQDYDVTPAALGVVVLKDSGYSQLSHGFGDTKVSSGRPACSVALDLGGLPGSRRTFVVVGKT